MGPVVVGIVVALAAAVGVLVVSVSVAGEAPGDVARRFVGDLRSALRGRRPAVPGRDGAAGARKATAAPARAEEAADGTVADLFAIGRPDLHGYVEVDELRRTVALAGRAVRGGVSQLTRR